MTTRNEALERFAIQIAHRVVDAAGWGFTAYLGYGDPDVIAHLKSQFPDCKIKAYTPSLLLIDWTPRGTAQRIGVLKTDVDGAGTQIP